MPAMCTSGGCSMASMESSSRPLKKAHLLRWGPRPHAQRTESTPRARPSGAASHLDLFERPAELLKTAHLLRWGPRPHAQRTESTPRARPSGAASHLDLFERPAELLKTAHLLR